jgi:Pre-toxin TG
MSKAQSFATKAVDAAKSFATKALEAAKSAGAKALAMAKSAATRAWDTAKSLGQKALSAAKDLAARAWDTAKSLGQKALSTAKDLAAKAWGAAKSLGSTAWGKVKDWGGKTWDMVRSGTSKLWGPAKAIGAKATAFAKKIGLDKAWHAAKRVGQAAWAKVSSAAAALKRRAQPLLDAAAKAAPIAAFVALGPAAPGVAGFYALCKFLGCAGPKLMEKGSGGGKAATDLATDVIPLVSTVKDGCRCLAGTNVVTNEEVGGGNRAMSCAFAALDAGLLVADVLTLGEAAPADLAIEVALKGSLRLGAREATEQIIKAVGEKGARELVKVLGEQGMEALAKKIEREGVEAVARELAEKGAKAFAEDLLKGAGEATAKDVTKLSEAEAKELAEKELKEGAHELEGTGGHKLECTKLGCLVCTDCDWLARHYAQEIEADTKAGGKVAQDLAEAKRLREEGKIAEAEAIEKRVQTDLELARAKPGKAMLGAGGTKTTSTTLLETNKFHIDVENPAPGVRPGQLHLQDYSGNKYLYNFETGEFEGLPRSLAKQIAKDPRVGRAIAKGRTYLGIP